MEVAIHRKNHFGTEDLLRYAGTRSVQVQRPHVTLEKFHRIYVANFTYCFSTCGNSYNRTLHEHKSLPCASDLVIEASPNYRILCYPIV